MKDWLEKTVGSWTKRKESAQVAKTWTCAMHLESVHMMASLLFPRRPRSLDHVQYIHIRDETLAFEGRSLWRHMRQDCKLGERSL